MGDRAVARFLRPPSSAGGLLAAAALFGASLTPSFYPRPWLAQGLLSGVALAGGYGLGAGAGVVARRLVRRPAPGTIRAARRSLAVVVATGVALWALLQNHAWQVGVREVMAAPPAHTLTPLATAVAALLSAYLLVVCCRLAGAGRARYALEVARRVPGRKRVVVHLLLAAALGVFVVDVVVGGWLFSSVDATLIADDAGTRPGVLRPASPYVSGGAGSLIAWDTLGSRGRTFVTQAPSVSALSAFSGRPAKEPIRVYAGLASAASHRDRAALAVAELERTGAFEREVLVVITPTGTGSINPFAVDPLEYMYNGDTAAVAVQYSYQPSWLVMAGNQERAKAGATALLEAVTRRLEREPVDARPRLLLYGESLGAFGSEAAFDDIDDLRGRADGALWVGPPRANRLWREFTAARDPGTPLWQPVYQGGTHVRFGWDGASLSRPGGAWLPPRVAYLQHATDPITWVSPSILVERPEWLDRPRGPGVAPELRWLPVVTFLQLTVDMVLGANAPVGHGHIYGPAQAEAWALVAPPATWTPASTARLVGELTDRPSG